MAAITVVWLKGWLLAGTLSRTIKPDRDLVNPSEVAVAWGHDGYDVRLLTSLPDLRYEVHLKSEDDESVAQDLLDDLVDSLETQR